MFKRRSLMLEVLDCPDVDDRFAERSYRFMRFANRFLGGYRVVQRFLAAELAGLPQGHGLRVLDLGCGACDIPLGMSRWARRRGIDIRFTCLDVLPQAEKIAQRNIKLTRDTKVTFLREDAFSHEPENQYDCAIASMFFHHLQDSEILQLVSRLRRYVRRSLLINDLRRDVIHYAGALLLRASISSDFLTDALLSIRRGFRARELAELLSRVEDAHVNVANAWMYRVMATVHFNSGGRTCRC
jgi:SAM-dependent methyltransferase